MATKPNRPSAGRKAQPKLSIEEELAELLSDPTLRPTINFLRPNRGFDTGTDSVSDIEGNRGIATKADTQSGAAQARQPVYNNDTSAPAPAPSSPQSSHRTSQIKTSPDPVSASASIADTETVADTGQSWRSEYLSATDSDPVPDLPFEFEDDQPRKPRYQRPKARRARTVEDGHSHAEHSLYTVLWEKAKPYSPDARVITIGFGTMSHLARLSLNNCRQNIRSLIHKLAIEEIRAEQSSEKIGKTYLLYSQAAIMRRRKAAGLEWVIRTKGVVFVDAHTGAILTDRSPIRNHTSDSVSTSDTDSVSHSKTIAFQT